jgi:hypothetical protein
LRLHFSTFVLAFLDICACISRHVCLHLLTYVTSFTLTCSTCVIAFMVRARQMCSYWTVICRNTYNFCHDKCKQMHKKNANICNNKCILNFAKINSFFITQNKILCMCCCIHLHIYLYIYTYNCSSIYSLCQYICKHICRENLNKCHNKCKRIPQLMQTNATTNTHMPQQMQTNAELCVRKCIKHM